jgi:hypothetical protein
VSNVALPMRGNLAWAALPGIDKVDVWDRFNGVPTLGVITAAGRHTLFWRAHGYVSDFSAWLYIPLQAEDVQRLREDDADPLRGLLFQSPVERAAWIAAANNNRLVFEREWVAPASASADQVQLEVATFLNEAIEVALTHELPPTRREILEQAARATKKASVQLVAASRR